MKYHSRHLGADIAGKDDARRLAPNPASAEMIAHLEDAGIETLSDRSDAQQPQCGFGLRGLCCRMCQMGPCRISDKSPRGVCGRDMELITVANLARAVAAGCSAQTMHARELALTLLGVTRGEIALERRSTSRLRDAGGALNVAFPWTPMEEVANSVARTMMDDLGRMSGEPLRALGFAPKERRRAWEAAGLTPRSAALEVVESLHMTTLGACSDWREMFAQAVRTSLAYAYSGLVGASVLTDILFGIPEPREVEVSLGVLKADHVNILVHGHSPVMLEKLLSAIDTEEIRELARESGAAGIVVGGMCCTGHEALARHGIPPVAGAMAQELAIGTGAVDAVVVDMQCVLPGMQTVAECFGTRIVTTCESNRIPAAVHVPFDPERPGTLDADAMTIARLAVDAFATRDRSSIHIPAAGGRATAGFTREAVLNSFGGVRKLLPLLESGAIRGIAAMVGCSTPKAPCEAGHVSIARELVRSGVLVLTSGCSAHAMFGAGLCGPDALRDAAPGLREACEDAGIPPVLAMGSCSDNARIIQVFAALAHEARRSLADMPFVLSGPELVNEKTVGQLVAMLAHGITSIVGLTPALPIPAVGPGLEAAEAGSSIGSNPMIEFFGGDGLASLVGARLLVRPDPADAAAAILDTLDAKRDALGWAGGTPAAGAA